jgi:hypothetical protein
MSATYYEDDGVTVCISDAGQAALAAEQRDIHHDQQRAEIDTWTLAASVMAIAVLVFIKIFGGAA